MPNTIVRTYPQRMTSSYYRECNFSAPTGTVTGTPTTWTDSISSTANPSWRHQVAHHENATTGRQVDVSAIRQHGYGYVDAYFRRQINLKNVYWSIVYGQFVRAVRPSIPTPVGKAENQARASFYKQLKGRQQSFQGLTFLGELGQTLRMLRNPAQAIRRGLDDYVKSVQKRTRRAKKSSFDRIVSDTWLEHVYGWAPLLSDVKSAGKALNDRIDRFSASYSRISASGFEEQASISGELQNEGFGVYLAMRYQRMTQHHISVRYYGEVSNECENQIQADTELFGVSWRDIVPTAWELIPYSFLADYFSNVGDVLSAWSTRKSAVRWCARTQNIRSISSIVGFYMDWSYTESGVTGFRGWISRSADSGSHRITRRNITRNTASVPLPDFRFEMPGFGTKWINMTALLASRNSTRKMMYR